jgi:NifB/MoaA-like Fe-S oxidoreductase
VAELTSLYQQPVSSLSVVPIGLTKHHRGQCRPYTADESRKLLDQVEPWREENRESWGATFVYPSDEWFLVAGRDVPSADEYDGFPQVENGVGMVRQLLDEWEMLRTQLPPLAVTKATLVCGTLIAPVMAKIVDELNNGTGVQVRLVPVVNRFFGSVTTVSGLLSGQDVLAELEGSDLGELLLLPRAMFTGQYGAGSAPPGTTLDDQALDDLSARLGVPIEMAGTMTEALAALT